jgi:hypothetical protein
METSASPLDTSVHEAVEVIEEIRRHEDLLVGSWRTARGRCFERDRDQTGSGRDAQRNVGDKYPRPDARVFGADRTALGRDRRHERLRCRSRHGLRADQSRRSPARAGCKVQPVARIEEMPGTDARFAGLTALYPDKGEASA